MGTPPMTPGPEARDDPHTERCLTGEPARRTLGPRP